MRDLLDDDSFHEQDSTPSPGLPYPVIQSDFMIFPTTSTDWYSAPLHSPISESSDLWVGYEKNVAPLVRVFHHPSLKALYQSCASGLQQPSTREGAVLAAVNFAAVVSLNPGGL